MLLNELQRQERTIEAQAARLTELTERLERPEGRAARADAQPGGRRD